MVADFGLAREIATGDVGSGSNATIARFTRTGQVLGTPPYMAPEQIRDARQADVRSDVYSLGATLYHTLTGRPPFQAASPAETLRQVLESEPVAPLQMNDAVELDLDTIVMKCLEKEPTRRYESAYAVVDDLQRYLDGRPISARRITPLGRVVRWSKRNRRTASLIAFSTTALLALVASVIVGLAVSNRKSQQIAHSLRVSRSSLDENYSYLLSSSAFANQPGQEAERKNMLQRSLKYYREFIKLANAPGMRTDLGIAQVRLGELTLELVGPAAAQTEFSNALATMEQLDEAARKPADVRRAMSDAYNGVGRALQAIGDYRSANVQFEKSAEIRKGLLDQHPGVSEYGRKYANSLMNQGLIKALLSDYELASQLQHQAQEMRVELLKRDPDNTDVLRDSGKGEYGLARLALDQQNIPHAELKLAAAAKAFQKLLSRTPTDGAAWMHLVRCQLLRSIVAAEQGQIALANQLLTEALESIEPAG